MSRRKIRKWSESKQCWLLVEKRGFSKIEKLLIVLVGLGLVAIAFTGSVCTGHYEGEKGASCQKIINIK